MSSLEIEDYLLLAAVLLLPWAFGGIEIWAFRSAAFLVVASASVVLWKRGLLGWGVGRGFPSWLLAAVLLGLWGAVQLLPLPPAAIRLLSPGAYSVYTGAFPGYAEAEPRSGLEALEERALERVPEASGRPLPAGPQTRPDVGPLACLSTVWRPLSLNRNMTLERLLWYVALLLACLVVRQRVRDPDRYRVYFTALLGLFAALAVFALVQAQTWNGKIYWIRRPRFISTPFGPYVNPNHFAGVMELAVPAMVGLAWSRLRERGREALNEAPFGATTVAAGICLAAGLAASSKLAALVLVTGLTVVGLAGARSTKARLGVAAGAIVLVGAAALLLAGTRLGQRVQSYLERVEAGHFLEGRLAVWRASGEMLQDFAVTGAGFGTFKEIFPRYMPAGASARWMQAHNDYLEFLLDGGIIGLLLLLWLVWGFGAHLLRGLRRPAPIDSLARVGLAVGVASLGLHAFFDFNHQMPGTALLFVSCCALLSTDDGHAKGSGGAR